jgi:hypothetical protein
MQFGVHKVLCNALNINQKDRRAVNACKRGTCILLLMGRPSSCQKTKFFEASNFPSLELVVFLHCLILLFFVPFKALQSMWVYSIHHRNEGSSSSHSDIHCYLIIGNLLDLNFNIILFLMWWDWADLVLRPLFGLLYQPQMIHDDCGAMGGMRIGWGNRSTGRKTAPVPLCPPHIPRDMTRARTRAAALGSQRLTAWAIARP